MARKTTAYVVPHTHWDRAWYLPFEEFRIRLVRLIDRLVRTLETDPGFRCFTLDGQTVVLEDYLDIRPAMSDRLKKLVQSKRLFVGPWYVLPDEFLVSAEAIVRNLMLGHRISGDFGHTMAVGYVPDPFGHIAQLPQILRGFGLDSFLFSRGLVTQEVHGKTEFTWEGLDGTRVLAIHQARFYNNGAFLGFRIPWGDAENLVFDMDLAVEQLRAMGQELSGLTHTQSILLSNGVDHSEHQPELPRILKEAAGRIDGMTFRISSFEQFVRSVKRQLEGTRLPVKRGELSYSFGDLLHGVYSSRMYLKTANRACQDLLEKQAEPLATLAWKAARRPYPEELLWHAWRELLKNHPHDDICGCSADQVHRDMEHRFGVVQQVGTFLVREAVRALGNAVDNSGQEGTPFIVFNPLGAARREVVTLPIDLHPEKELWRRFSVHDEQGAPIPFVLDHSEDVAWMEPLKGVEMRRHWVTLELTVPGCGYRTLYVRHGASTALESRVSAGDRSFENEFYRLAIESDGSLTLRDKTSGSRFKGLLAFEDQEDAGDVYNWSPLPQHPAPVTTAGERATVKRLAKGPLSSAWRITHKMLLPESLSADRKGRAGKRVTQVIEAEVHCRAGSPRIDVTVRLKNRVCDHRMRVLFPTSVRSDTVHVDGHFGIIERSTTLPPPRNGMPPYPTHHAGRFVDLSDGRTGFAVINDGLPEFEVLVSGKRRILAQTLYRSVDGISRDDLITRPGHTGPPMPTPEAQCLCPMTFKLAFMAHEGDWRAVLHEAQRHNTGVLISRCDMHGGTEPRYVGFMKDNAYLCGQPMRDVPRKGSLKDTGSFVDIGTEDMVLSAVKKCERRESLVVRLYNPGPEMVSSVLRLWRPVKSAYTVNLNEQRQGKMRVSGGGVPYRCRGYGVLTVELLV